MSLTVKIITPEKALPELESDHVTLPAHDGGVGIRTGHAPFVCQLGAGTLVVKHGTSAADNDLFALQGGVAQVQDNVIRILAESCTKTDDISEADLEKRLHELDAGDYAKETLRLQAVAEVDWIRTQLKSKGRELPQLKNF